MPINHGMMSSNRHDYSTPQDLFDNLNALYGFGLDAASNDDNAKVERHYTKDDDGLSQPWDVTTWVNPEYGRGIGEWVKRGLHQSQIHNVTVVMLIPARTDTGWFHKYVMRAEKIYFIKGRLQFLPGQPAPFPSMLVFFNGKLHDSPQIYSCDKVGNIIVTLDCVYS